MEVDNSFEKKKEDGVIYEQSPRKAFKNGSDWLVIGRPIIKGNIKINLKKLSDHLKK